MVNEYSTLTNELLGEYKSVWDYYMNCERSNSYGAECYAWEARNKRKQFKKETYISDKPIHHAIYEYDGIRYPSLSACIRANGYKKGVKKLWI